MRSQIQRAADRSVDISVDVYSVSESELGEGSSFPNLFELVCNSEYVAVPYVRVHNATYANL